MAAATDKRGGGDERGPTVQHIGEAADKVASDVHKLVTYAAMVRRDLVHELGAEGDAATLCVVATQLRNRADHLATLAEELADVAVP